MSNNKEMLAFDDVVLIPQYSTLKSRQDADTSCQLFDLELKAPIITSNMESVTGAEMCKKVWELGGIGCMHRFMTIEENIDQYLEVVNSGAKCIVSIGCSEEEKARALCLKDAGARYYCIDIAHGHSTVMEEMLLWFKEAMHGCYVMAGNVATPQGVTDLEDWGADAIKVGVGSGSVCTTRVVTGHGSPTFTGMLECAQSQPMVPLIQDGGIRNSGDITKSFVAGANMVMIGSLAAGTSEAPGELIDSKTPGKKFKKFFGSSSYERKNTAKEGVETLIEYKGSFEPIFKNLVAGLRSGMSYCNSPHLNDIYYRAKWRKQSLASSIEGKPHIYNK